MRWPTMNKQSTNDGLNNISLDNDKFDEDDPFVRVIVWCNRFKQSKV